MPTDDELNDRIDAWHAASGISREMPMDARPLHEALGWTAEEYARWVADPAAVPDRPLPPYPAPDAED